MSGKGRHNEEGNTPAAWTTVAIIILGAVVSGSGLIADSPVVVFAGFGVIILGAIVGKVMQMMGLGKQVA
jgi:hypothetical protein